MNAKNFKNHSRILVGYHYVGTALVVISLGWSIRLVIRGWGTDGVEVAFVLLILSVLAGLLGYYARAFPLKAQDRVIRLEENFRHKLLHGSPLPDGLTMRQIIALRFACDEEFSALIAEALEKNLGEDDIKQAIANWRPDEERVWITRLQEAGSRMPTRSRPGET